MEELDMLVKLGDIAEVLISNVDKKSKPNEKEIKLCNFVDVYKNYAITDRMTSSFMVATASNQSIEKFTIKKGYLAITKDSETRDDIGVGTYFADDFDNLLLGYHCALIKPNNKLVYSKYLNAFIQSNFVRKYYELNASGSGQRYTLTLESILSTPILLPDYDKQVLIGDMLSNTDHQIERNNLMVKKLQVLTHSAFDYFSKHNNYENKIALNDIIVEKNKSQIQVNNIIDGSGDIPFFTSGESILYTDNSLTNGFNIFLSTGGNAKVQSYYGNVSYSTDTWCITSKNNLQYYLYGYLKHIENQMDKLYFHGTGLKHLQKPLFLKSIIEIPNNSVIQKFNLIVEPMYIQISKLTQSNVKLQRLKNKLLPLLINQQLL